MRPCVRDSVDDYTFTRAPTRAGASQNPADMTTYRRIGLACAIGAAACARQGTTTAVGREQSSIVVNCCNIGDSASHARVTQTAGGPNTLTAAEQRSGWRLLFDGRTFNGWRGLGYDTVPTAHWKIENGTIRKLADGQVPRLPDGQPAAGGDLMTRDTFRDFELTWEWKISPAGNSGVKYNVSEEI